MAKSRVNLGFPLKSQTKPLKCIQHESNCNQRITNTENIFKILWTNLKTIKQAKKYMHSVVHDMKKKTSPWNTSMVLSLASKMSAS